MVTENRNGQAKDVDVEQEVAAERHYIEFPPKYAYIKEMSINGIVYINTLMTDADEETLSIL